MTSVPTHKQQAEQQAIALAIERLGALGDWPARCARLGLPAPAEDGSLQVPVFGRPLRIAPPAFAAVVAATGAPAKPVDQLLALHYLLHDGSVTAAAAEWITFRDFPGGAFYWEPFLSRSIRPLLQRVGNDLALLRAQLGRFPGWQEEPLADGLCARVPAIGPLALRLVYRPGDEEFPATADLLFPAALRRVYPAEDAAALGSRLCLGLL